MSYVFPDYKTKKELKEAVANGEKLQTYSPGPFPAKQDGEDIIEGPRYPKPHRWYARVEVREGFVTKVLS